MGPDRSAPTAPEIVGGPAPARRREYQYREARLKREVVDFFSGAAHVVRTEVDCGVAGYADVVTEDAVYELKDRLTRRTFYQARGQLFGYRKYLNPALRPYIICNGTNLTPRKLEKFETHYGVRVLVWDPPYAEAVRLNPSHETHRRRPDAVSI